LQTLRHKSGVTHALFVQGDTKIVTGCNRGAFLWHSSSGQKLAEYGGGEEMHYLAVGVRGGFVATFLGNNLAALWDASTGRLIAKIGSDRVASAAFSHDDKRVVVGSLSGNIRVFATEDGREVLRLGGHVRGVSSVRFSEDDRLILSASFDGTARLWDATTGAQLGVLSGHSKGVTVAMFGLDATIVTAALDGTARVWDFNGLLATDRSPEETAGSTFGDRKLVVQEHIVKIVDAATGAEKVTLKGHTGTVFAASFSADGDLVATASYDGTAGIWKSTTGARTALLRGHSGPVLSVAFSGDGRRVATGSADQTAIVWDISTGQLVARIGPLGQEVQRIWFSADLTRVLTALRGGSVFQWRHFPTRRSFLPTRNPSYPAAWGGSNASAFFSRWSRRVGASPGPSTRTTKTLQNGRRSGPIRRRPGGSGSWPGDTSLARHCPLRPTKKCQANRSS
jgi:WD40 repeat protein